MTDLGFTVLVQPGASVVICRQGECFELRADAPPSPEKEPPWEPPPDVVFIRAPDGEFLGALQLEHLPAGDDETSDQQPTVTVEQAHDALVNEAVAGATRVIRVQGPLLDIDKWDAVLGPIVAVGGRVRFDVAMPDSDG